MGDVTARVMGKVQVSDGCWLWTGGTCGAKGYGPVKVAGRNLLANPVVWELVHGPSPRLSFSSGCARSRYAWHRVT